MRVTCAHCNRVYDIKEALVSPRGIRIKCPNCAKIFPVKPPTLHEVSLDGTDTSDNESTSKFRSETIPHSTESAEKTSGEIEETHIQPEPDVPVRPRERTQTAARRGEKQLEQDDSEISLVDEISKISPEAEPEFETSIHYASEESTNSAGTPAEMPNTLKTVNPDSVPTKKRGPRDESVKTPAFSEDTPLRAEQVQGRLSLKRRPNIWIWLGLSLAFFGILTFGLFKKNFFLPVKFSTPQPVQDLNTLFAAPDAEMEDALNFCSLASLRHVMNLAGKRGADKATQAHRALAQAFIYYLFDDPSVYTAALSETTAFLVTSVNDPVGLLAIGLLLAGRENADLDRATKMLEPLASAPVARQFLKAVIDLESGAKDAALQNVSELVKAKPNVGPILRLAEIAYGDRPEQATATGQLEKLRALIVERRGTFAAFLPERKVAAAPKTEITPEPKPVQERPVREKRPPIVKSSPKPTPLPTRATPRATPALRRPEGVPDGDQGLSDLLAQGDRLLKQEKFNQAIAVYQSALKVAGNKEGLVQTKIGNVWFKLFRIDEAYNSFQRAVTLDPNQADAHKGLAVVYDHLGDLDKAAREYTLYLQLKPNAEDAPAIRALLEKIR